MEFERSDFEAWGLRRGSWSGSGFEGSRWCWEKEEEKMRDIFGVGFGFED